MNSINSLLGSETLDQVMGLWSQATPQDITCYNINMQGTRQAETTCRHALENYKKNLHVVQELECKLEISRWVPGDPEWENAACLVSNRKYQCAIDHLESLVVSRIFELTRMNRAGTGLYRAVIFIFIDLFDRL